MAEFEKHYPVCEMYGEMRVSGGYQLTSDDYLEMISADGGQWNVLRDFTDLEEAKKFFKNFEDMSVVSVNEHPYLPCHVANAHFYFILEELWIDGEYSQGGDVLLISHE